ncbi:hypothetical protein Tco_1568476, partial [Tanacetum coccineum]
MLFLSLHHLSTLKKARDLSAPFDKNRPRAASFPLRLCMSFIVLGWSRSVTALTFKGLDFMPCLVMRCPKKGPSSTSNEHFFGFSFTLIDQNLSKAVMLRSGPKPLLFCFIGLTWLYSFCLCSVLKGFSSTIMVLGIPVISACVYAKTSAFDFKCIDATEDPFLVCGKYVSGPLRSFISFVCR